MFNLHGLLSLEPIHTAARYIPLAACWLVQLGCAQRVAA